MSLLETTCLASSLQSEAQHSCVISGHEYDTMTLFSVFPLLILLIIGALQTGFQGAYHHLLF